MASIAAIGVAGIASADSGHSAKTYKASLAAVNPAATTAGLASVAGSAQLVDGKKHNKVSLHMRNLAAGHHVSVARPRGHLRRHRRTGRRLDLPHAGRGAATGR